MVCASLFSLGCFGREVLASRGDFALGATAVLAENLMSPTERVDTRSDYRAPNYSGDLRVFSPLHYRASPSGHL